MSDANIDTLFDEALQAQADHSFGRAEQLYNQILALNPNDPDALHLLGVLFHQTQRPERAIELLTTAVRLDPTAALFQFNLAEALRANKAFETAATHYLLAIELDPSMTTAYLPLAESFAAIVRKDEAAAQLPLALSVAITPGDLLRVARCANLVESLDVAVDAATRASKFDPNNVEILDLLANLLTRTANFPQLVDIYQRLIILDPMDHYYVGLASAYAERHDYVSAKTAALHALELFPHAHKAHFILAHCAQQQADWIVAAHHYAEVVKADPKHVPSLGNLAIALRSSGCPLEAIDCLKEAEKYAGDSFELYYNLAYSYENLGRYKEAIPMCHKALELNPNHAPSINLLGAVLQKSRRSQEACEILLPYILEHPDDCNVHSTLASVYLDRGELPQALDSFRRSVDPTGPKPPVNGNVLLTATYDDTLPPRELFDLHVAWGAQQAKPDSPAPSVATRNHPKIRIGYVSGDFRTHSVAFFVCPVLMFHDQSAFEIYCYANTQNPDHVTQMFQGLGHQWRHIAGLNDERVFDMVRRDEIDILVDLAGHTSGTRLPLFAKRPAPIQVGMIGYPCTTGLPTIDYQITDPIIHPPGLNEPLATENLVRLPNIFACYRPPDNAPDVKPLPALAAGHITFGYFNNLAKLRDSVLTAWAHIAKRLPTAKFVIQTGALDDPAAREITANRCIAAGIPAQSIDIRGNSTLSAFHDDLNAIDIVLDPFPFNGHTTSCQILHMGVPIVTLAGKTRSGRMGASLLHNLGLRHLIAHSPEQYADIAVRLASNLPALASLRSSLRSRMETSSIMDAPRYVHHLESEYRKMVERAIADERSGTER